MVFQAALETLRDYSKAAATVAKNYEERTAVGNFLKRRIKKTLEFLRHTRLVFHSGLAVTVWYEYEGVSQKYRVIIAV